uniref:Uncharacterized protein n=1 Tax=Cyprinus carpio TaxID=7962 RepID=A0A8C1ISU0_CYPCA
CHNLATKFCSTASSQQLAQASYPSESQASLQQPAQSSYQYMAQPALQQPAQDSYALESQASIQQPAQSSYPSESQASFQQPAQASYQSVAQPAFQQPTQVGYPSESQASVQQPPQAKYQSVYRTVSSLQRPQSSHQSVVQHGIQMAFKPVQAQGGHVSQIGSKLYSCQEYVSHPNYQLAAQPGQNGNQPPSRLVSSSLAQHIKPVVQHEYRAPVKPGQGTYVYVVSPSRPPGLLQSTLLSTFRPAQLPEQPSYQPPVLPNVHQSSFKPMQSSYKPSSKIEPSSYQPQMLPSHQSLSQSGYSFPSHASTVQLSGCCSPAIPVPSIFEPQVQSSYETLSQPRFQTSMPGQSSYQSVSRSCSQSLEQASSLSNSESVQPGIQYPAQLNYQAVTNQNAPGPAQSNQRMSQTSFRLLKQVMSWLFIFVCRFLVLACLL